MLQNITKCSTFIRNSTQALPDYCFGFAVDECFMGSVY